MVAGVVALAGAIAAAVWLSRGWRLPAGRDGALASPAPWTPADERKPLPREFIWTGSLIAPLAEGRQCRVRLSGQTRTVTVVCGRDDVSVSETTGPSEVRELARSAWPRALGPGDCFQVVKSADAVSVFLNSQGVLVAPCAIETWSSGVCDLAGACTPFVTFRFQKTEPPFLSDDFMHGEGELGEWRSEQGTWRVHALQNPIRSANPFSFWGKGDPAVAVTGQWFWRNYELTAAVQPLPGGAFGLLLCRADAANGYHLRWLPASGTVAARLQVVKLLTGVESVLAEAEVPFLPSRWLQLRVAQLDGQITASVDGHAVLRAQDPAPFLGGQVGLWTEGGRGAVFDDVSVAPVSSAEFDADTGLASLVITASGAGQSTPVEAAPDGVRLPPGGAEFPVPGLVRDNVAVEARLQGLDAAGATVELQARQSGNGDCVGFRVIGAGAEVAAQLFLRQGSQERRLAEAPTGPVGSQTTVSLHVQEDECWGCVDGRLVCLGSGVRGLGRGRCEATLRPGAQAMLLEHLSVRPQQPLPAVLDRVETFTHEESMQTWNSPAFEWTPEEDAGGQVFWHSLDLWQDFSAELNLAKLGDVPVGTGFGLVCRGGGEGEAAAQRVSLRLAGGGADREMELVLSPERALRQALPAAMTTVAIEKRRGRLLVRVDGAVVWNEPLPQALAGLCQVGRSGEGSPETWARAIQLRAEGVESCSFQEAPTDWLPVAGVWEITNRWQCDPRWSFYSGTKLHGLACNWSKRRHGRNVTLEFFAGPRMDRDRGTTYNYAADFNAVLATDGSDIVSGYSFLFGGYDDKGSYILRGTTVLAENPQVLIPREAATHRRWFHVKIRKHGDTLAFRVDGREVAIVKDPEPLTGDRFGLWTWNNGVMFAQVRISTDGDLAAAPAPATIEVPKTPYDTDGM
ncbi:MAG: hypothetical protein GX595_08980 [Lentisphaerae bacterium]|nr:hypothetical protein [Lentisphaerota bacterium]